MTRAVTVLEREEPLLITCLGSAGPALENDEEKLLTIPWTVLTIEAEVLPHVCTVVLGLIIAGGVGWSKDCMLDITIVDFSNRVR